MEDPEARQGLLREKMAPKKKASVLLLDSAGAPQQDESTDPDVRRPAPPTLGSPRRCPPLTTAPEDRPNPTAALPRRACAASERRAQPGHARVGCSLAPTPAPNILWRPVGVQVSPRQMSEAIMELKARFGNVDENYDTGFVQRLLKIADEAEAVALDLAGGKELSSREQQDMAWERSFVSVWDLAQVGTPR